MFSSNAGMKIFKDQMGRKVQIPFPPKKIISLVPSLTELLCSLGLYNEVVGITKFCKYPSEKFKSAVKIGGTKTFHFDRIDALKPDLIIGNKEENYEEGIRLLEDKYPVWMSDISTIEEALNIIIQVGKITGKTESSLFLYSQLRKSFGSLVPEKLGTAAYVIWKKPTMVAAGNTLINEMLKSAGFENVFKDLSKYPVVSPEMIYERDPNFIFLSSEPFPFKEKHIKEFKSISPNAIIKLVDGELFSWFGSRLLHSPEYFKQLRRAL